MAALPEDQATQEQANPEDEKMKEELVNKMLTILEAGSTEECAICMDDWKRPVITHCAHVFCKPCIDKVISEGEVRILGFISCICVGCDHILWYFSLVRIRVLDRKLKLFFPAGKYEI